MISIFLYIVGIPVMVATDNLESFLSEPQWVFLTIYGFVSGISVIFIFRKFQDSLTRISHLIGSEEKFLKVNNKLLGCLTHKVLWIFIAFWPVINIGRLFVPTDRMNWWWFYDQPFLSTVYYYVEGIPAWIFGGIFFYMIPFGLTLAYRELCLKTSFKEALLSTEWMEPFFSFKSLITLTMFIAVINALLGIIVWSPTLEQTPLILFPYASMAVILIPTILFPHYFFHKLFSITKQKRIKELQKKLSKIKDSEKNDKISEILLLLKKSEVEKMKTWLLDVKILGEVIIVALMHVILIEVLTTIVHG
jgi:hypothetical protein